MEKYRVLFKNLDDNIEAEEILDKSGQDYDYDNGGGMIIDDNGLEELETNNVDFDRI